MSFTSAGAGCRIPCANAPGRHQARLSDDYAYLFLDGVSLMDTSSARR
jgi:hypothetical protein